MKIRIKDKVDGYLWYKSLEGKEIEVCEKPTVDFTRLREQIYSMAVST